MWTALVTMALASAPATGLTLSAQLGKSSTPAETYLSAIARAFEETALETRRLSTNCEGDRACLRDAGRTAGLPALVAVTLAVGKKQTTIDLEALRVHDGAAVGQLTFVVKGRFEERHLAQLRELGKQVLAALPPPTPPDDAPTEPPPTLPPPQDTKEADPLMLTQKPTPRTRVPAYLMGGAAAASAITSGIFLGVASGARGELDQGLVAEPVPLTRAEAQQLVDTANTGYSVALATGIAAGALVLGTILWLATE